MKLILRADVDNLGRLGEIVKVKPGYGRNYLLPQGLAMVATESNQRVFERERKKLQAMMDAVKAQAQALADQIAKASLVIKVRVGEGNKMYGSVTPANIAEALEAKGVAIDRRKLVIDEPLRALGDYTIEVKLHPDVRGELKVSVVAHDAGQAAESEGAE